MRCMNEKPGRFAGECGGFDCVEVLNRRFYEGCEE